MKATQLDDVLNWYEEASFELKVARDALERKKIQCLQHKKDLEKSEKLLQFYLEIDEKKRKLDSLKKEYYKGAKYPATFDHWRPQHKLCPFCLINFR